MVPEGEQLEKIVGKFLLLVDGKLDQSKFSIFVLSITELKLNRKLKEKWEGQYRYADESIWDNIILNRFPLVIVIVQAESLNH